MNDEIPLPTTGAEKVDQLQVDDEVIAQPLAKLEGFKFGRQLFRPLGGGSRCASMRGRDA